MQGLFPVLALVLSLFTGGGDFVRTTATVLGLEVPPATEKPALPPDRPMTDSGCSMDPLGCPRG